MKKHSDRHKKNKKRSNRHNHDFRVHKPREFEQFNRGLRWIPILFLLTTFGLTAVLYKFYSVSIPGFIMAFLIAILLLREASTLFFARRLNRRIIKPMEDLTRGFEEIASGEYGYEIDNKYRHQMGKVIKSFNEMSKELKEAQELKALYDKNQKELIAGISHDLKSPMTSILGYLEGIEEGVANSPEKLESYLKVIYNNAAYSNKLIDDLFLISKLDLNQQIFNMEKLMAKPFFEDILLEKKLSLEEINFEYENNVDDGVTIELDPSLFIRVLNNIYDNAKKYNHKDEVEITTHISSRSDLVEIIITDNGPGIDESMIDKIFSKFYRADVSRSKQIGGSGLGLSIASEIVQAHGGEISAKNTDSGLEIKITLKGELDG